LLIATQKEKKTMKRFTIAIMIMAFAMGIPVVVMAMDHGDMKHDDKGMKKGHEMGMDHGKEMSHDMQKDHDMGGGDDFVEVGKDTQKGIVATVKVKTYDDETKATMAKMNMDATHHVMVFFADEKSGESVGGGKAALKVKEQGGKPTMLMQMGEGFGADVKFEGMMITFEIGTKLEDGKKRQFSIKFHNM
jgi:hypothetical protein